MPATNGVFESDNIIPAAYAALDEINANCSILENYTLQIDFVNTEVRASMCVYCISTCEAKPRYREEGKVLVVVYVSMNQLASSSISLL